jgi:hypothetical protein
VGTERGRIEMRSTLRTAKARSIIDVTSLKVKVGYGSQSYQRASTLGLRVLTRIHGAPH